MSDDAPHSPLEEIVHAFARALTMAFGAPAQIIAARLDRKTAAKLRRHIAALELLVRRLLLTIARTLSLAPKRAAASPTGKIVAAPPPAILTAHSEAWRVSFHLAPPQARAAARRIERKSAGVRRAAFIDAAPLAMRLEAALRVLRDPARYAHRLARRLQTAPALAPRISSACPRAPDGAIAWFLAQPETAAETATLLDTS